MKRKKLKAKRRKEKLPALPDDAMGATGIDNGPVTTAASNGDPPYSVDALLARAEALLDDVELEAAQRFCLRALEADPSNVRALELCGLLLLEGGGAREAEARFCFERVAELSPRPHHSVLLYLAQLSEGTEAVTHTERALQLMQQVLEAPSASPADTWHRHKAPTWRDVSNAHCAIAELFMTDLCDAPEAEQRCTESVAAAVTVDPANPEAMHLRASLHLIKGEVEPAKAAMTAAVQLWLPALRAAMDKGAGAENADAEITDADNVDAESADAESAAAESTDAVNADADAGDVTEATGLTFDARLKAAQTLVELQMLDEAADVLESLQAEDDEDVQVLYLSCIVHFRLWKRSTDTEEAEEAAENARIFLQSGLELVKGGGQEEIEGHLREMLEAMGSAGEVGEDEGEIPESSDEEDMEQS